MDGVGDGDHGEFDGAGYCSGECAGVGDSSGVFAGVGALATGDGEFGDEAGGSEGPGDADFGGEVGAVYGGGAGAEALGGDAGGTAGRGLKWSGDKTTTMSFWP